MYYNVQMAEKVPGYNLTQEELNIELGVEADPVEVRKQVERIVKKWPEAKGREKPCVLLLGGFQGSGKTTTLDSLSQKLGLVVISPDEIRHNLFAEGHTFSLDFVKIVNATKFALIEEALSRGYVTAVDQALTPDRVKMVKEVTGGSQTEIVSIFLVAPKDILRQRVLTRPSLPGRYTGKVDELEASLAKYEERYGDPSQNGYDLVIDTSKNDLQKVTDLIQKVIRKKI